MGAVHLASVAWLWTWGEVHCGTVVTSAVSEGFLGRERQLWRQTRKPVSSEIQVEIKILGVLESGSPVQMFLSREDWFDWTVESHKAWWGPSVDAAVVEIPQSLRSQRGGCSLNSNIFPH